MDELYYAAAAKNGIYDCYGYLNNTNVCPAKTVAMNDSRNRLNDETILKFKSVLEFYSDLTEMFFCGKFLLWDYEIVQCVSGMGTQPLCHCDEYRQSNEPPCFFERFYQFQKCLFDHMNEKGYVTIKGKNDKEYFFSSCTCILAKNLNAEHSIMKNHKKNHNLLSLYVENALKQNLPSEFIEKMRELDGTVDCYAEILQKNSTDDVQARAQDCAIEKKTNEN